MLFKKTGLMLSVVVLLFGAGVGSVEAASVTWSKDWGSTQYLNSGNTQTIAGPEDNAIYNITASVTYRADLKNATSGAIMGDTGGSLAVGQKVSFTAKNIGATDGSWNAIGYTFDSPYVVWYSSSRPAACSIQGSGYSIHSAYGAAGSGGTNLFLPRPTITFSHTGTGTLGSCSVASSGGNTVKTCTVTGAGTINTSVNFSAVADGFYVDVPPTVESGCVRFGPFVNVSVPLQVANLSFTAIAPNSPPNAPTITGPTTGLTGTTYDFSFSATDPESNRIWYEVDWNNDESADLRRPGTGDVASGTSESGSNSTGSPFNTSGAKTFKVRAVDAGGGPSSWASHTITLSTPTGSWTATACLTSCGTSYMQPYACTGGNGLCAGSKPADVSCTRTACVTPTGTWTATCSTACGSSYWQAHSCTGGNGLCSGSQPADVWCTRSACPTGTWTVAACDTSCGTSYMQPYACTGGNGICSGSQPASVSCVRSACPTLKICENPSGTGNSWFERTNSSTTINEGANTRLKAVYDANTGVNACNGVGTAADKTTTTSWNELGTPGPVTLSGTDPKSATAGNVSSTQSEQIQAVYSGQTKTVTINVSCIPLTNASCPVDTGRCTTDTFTMADSCGGTVTCNGAKDCSFNWKEVSP